MGKYDQITLEPDNTQKEFHLAFDKFSVGTGDNKTTIDLVKVLKGLEMIGAGIYKLQLSEIYGSDLAEAVVSMGDLFKPLPKDLQDEFRAAKDDLPK